MTEATDTQNTAEKGALVPPGRDPRVALPLSSLKQSPTNLRTIGSEDIGDLAASVASRGILIPLLVRPKDGGKYFEVVDGHRRLAAALIVANSQDLQERERIAVLPVTVAELTDDEAAELQIVTNVQRASLHYLDESAAFGELVRRGYDILGIAVKVGKSVKYVGRRIGLGALSDGFKKLAIKGALPEKSAEFLASLPPKAQAHIYERCVRKMGSGKGAEVHVGDIDDLRRTAQNVTIIDLVRAPFSPDDAGLVPRAGSCGSCPKRVGVNPLLFDGYADTTCTDAACYFEKVAAHIAVVEKAHAANGTPLLKVNESYSSTRGKGVLERGQFVEAKPGSCEHAKSAVLVDVEYDSKRSVGEVITVCAEPKCKVHRGGGFSGSPFRRSPQELAEERKRTRAKTLAVSVGRAQIEALAGEIAARKLTPARIDSDELGRIVRAYLDKLGFDALKAVALSLGADKPQLKDPRKFVFGRLENSKTISEDLGLLYRAVFVDVLMGLDNGYYGTDDRKALRATLARYGVDGDGVAEGVRALLKAKWAKADARGKGKKKDKKAGGKPTTVRGVCRHCGCTHATPCAGGCAWEDKARTVCTNPTCQKAEAERLNKLIRKTNAKVKRDEKARAAPKSTPVSKAPAAEKKPNGVRKSRKPGRRGKKWIN